MTHSQTIAVEQLSCRDARTYLLSALFIAGNIIMPQLCHLVPGGGLRWLPIYFFTLVAAYRFGLAAGVVTSICSPIVNNLAFGMPPASMLPVILVKSTLLAFAASTVAARVGKPALWAVALAVAAYQAAGSAAEWGITGSLDAALQDLRIGWPGMLLQTFGGWIAVSLMKSKTN